MGEVVEAVEEVEEVEAGSGGTLLAAASDERECSSCPACKRCWWRDARARCCRTNRHQWNWISGGRRPPVDDLCAHRSMGSSHPEVEVAGVGWTS